MKEATKPKEGGARARKKVSEEATTVVTAVVAPTVASETPSISFRSLPSSPHSSLQLHRKGIE